jgi:hypothetical protein
LGVRLVWWFAALVIAISFVICADFRDQHFQELDSYTVGDFFADPHAAVVEYALFGYGVGHAAPGQGAAAKSVRAAPDFALRAIGRTSIYHRFQTKFDPQASASSDPEAVRAVLARGVASDSRLNTLGGHALYRLGLLAGVSAAPLPDVMRDAILLPLGSTYSFGPALIYSALWALQPEPAAFVHSATLATIAVFHLAALLLLGTAVRLRLPPAVGAVMSVWFVFASTPGSYAFHLGSSVWMMAASAAFLFVVAKHLPRRDRARRVSWVTAALVFFSYLVVVYFAGFALCDLLERLKGADRPGWRALIREILVDYWPAAFGLVACAVLFYEPGQGARGAMASLGEAPTYFAYIVLNLFGIAGGGAGAASAIANALQIALVSALLILGVVQAWGVARGPETPARTMARVFGCVGLVYVGMSIAGLLAPAPTRHMLFLAPMLYLILAFGLASAGSLVSKRLPGLGLMPAASVLLLAIVAGIGLGAQQARFTQVRAAYLGRLPQGRYLGVVGNESPIAWSLRLPRLRTRDLQNLSGSVLYADSDCDLTCFRKGAAVALPAGSRFVPLPSADRHAKMIAFVPPIDDSRFPFDRWNRVYLGRIDVGPAATQKDNRSIP